MISNQVIEYDNLLYSINEEEKAAFLVGNKNKKDSYFIPRSIIYESKEYIVKRICKYAFKDTLELRSIEIASNSEITTIENKVFVFSQIERINIPSSVIEIKEKCFADVFDLTKISIDSNNKRYSFYDGKFIIGKSSIDNNNYDTLIFSVRNIEKATIPSFIEIIGPFSFNLCMLLKNIEFSSDSRLRKINKSAFNYSSIESINIPSSLISIDKNAFYNCRKLENIEIPQNSQLQTIGEKAFYYTSIKSLFLPLKIIDLQKNWCYCTYLLTDITIDPNNQRYSLVDNKFIIGKSDPQKENFDSFVFCSRNVEEIIIPNYIEIIEQSSIQSCKKLQRVEFQENSKLKIIDELAFSDSSIDSITLPLCINKICKNAFIFCKGLREIEIPNDSDLLTIEESSFSHTSIENISIPSNLVELKKGWCKNLTEITSISISPINKHYSLYYNKYILGKSSIDNEYFDLLVFSVRNIRTVKIPSFIKKIEPFAFNECVNIRTFEISNDSNLQIIDENAFDTSSINKFIVPLSLTKINKKAFEYCFYLKYIKISNDSNLQVIDDYAFSNTKIESIYIPPLITHIGKEICFGCKFLQIIEFDENLELSSLDKQMFIKSTDVIFIIPIKLSNRFNLV